MAQKNYSLKDNLFNKESVSYLCNAIKNVYPSFKSEDYLNKMLKNFPELELKERMTFMATTLYTFLPKDYIESTHILKSSLQDVPKESIFVFGSYCELITIYGCNDKRLDYSLDLLCEFTKWFSSEYAIRNFITLYPKETFTKLEACSLSHNFHQRRFASEGLRPKLPWAKAIEFDYRLGAILLNNLYYDSERYVTRSVANHLNDLSKIDPDLVIDILKSWQQEGKQEEKELNYIINHSLRTLIKKGHSSTLEFLGFHLSPNIVVSNLTISSSILNLGDSLIYSFDIKALEDEQLIIDYQITYPMAKNKKSTKVFKLKKDLFKKGSTTKLSKKHPFKLMTTKKLYSGIYDLHIQINGKFYCHDTFELSIKE